ncbi:hypothetical protein F4802DRAFT_614557 [Xylaria palmicola]|nr:hypothetical protein F4802DRAFT_614557 [Xylaria palmicola]
MGVAQSKETGLQTLETVHPSLPEHASSTSSADTTNPTSEAEARPAQQQRDTSPKLTNSLEVPQTYPTPISLSPLPPKPGVFNNNENKIGDSPTSPIIISSDDEDVATLLRKYRTGRAAEREAYQVARRDNWKSLDIEWWKKSGVYGGTASKGSEATSSSRIVKSRGSVGSKHRLDHRGIKHHDKKRKANDAAPKPRHNRSVALSDHWRAVRPVPRSDAREAKPQRASEATNITRLNPSHTTRDPKTYFNAESAILGTGQGGIARSTIEGNAKHGINVQKTRQRPRQSHAATKSKLAPFRRANRKPQAHIDAVSTPDPPEETLGSNCITSRVDAGGLSQDIRPHSTSGPRSDRYKGTRIPASKGIRGASQPVRQPPPAPTHHSLDDIFTKPGACNQEEERLAELARHFERQWRPREYVVPELKWGYTIKYVDSADLILDDEDRDAKAATDRSFADRAQANEYLYKKTSPDAVGGLEAVARRSTALRGPERLLSVDIELCSGEHHLMWVERAMVVLGELKEERRRQVQWRPTPRPTMPHYVVTCDLITYESCGPVFRRDDDDDDDDDNDEDGMSICGTEGGLGPSGTTVSWRIEKCPLATFTIRAMANEHAGELLLAKSKVDERFAEPSDAYWWQQHVLPAHKQAMARARGPGGLYEMAMDAHNMSSRLGWDQIMVHVHEVDDVSGPVNF